MEDHIIGFEALYDSMQRCRKGVLWKCSVASYFLNGLERTLELKTELSNGTYVARPVYHFRVTSPKPRDIASICFRDRVYQRSLNDNAVYPAIARMLIHDNFACQKGKGTDAARDRLADFLRRHYRKHGPDGYVAQFDIHGYYPNMPHKLVESVFRRQLEPLAFARAKRVLHEQYEGDTGYNPGSQLVQIAGISALNRLDHYVKEQLRAKFYIRYMDDFMIVHHDRAFAEDCAEKIKVMVERQGFEINPKKTRVYPLKESIEFLGFNFRLTDTGKVLMLICPKNVKAARKRLTRLAAKVRKGEVTRAHADAAYTAWRSHAAKGNSYRLLQRMDAFYSALWRQHDGD